MITKKPKLIDVTPGKAAESAEAGKPTLVDVREADERKAIKVAR